MAGLTRKTSIQFGGTGVTSNFGQFGSKEAGIPQTSQDPAVIQQLLAWSQGWTSAVVSGDRAAYIEDMNGLCFVDSYQLTYLFQMGIPEWDSATLYFTGSIIQTQTNGQWFKSLQGGVPGAGAGQSGNTPPASASNAFWLWINPPENLVGSQTVNKLPKVTSTSPSNGVPGCVTLGDSLLSESGGNIVLASGGLQFPDATVQTTAATNPNAVTNQGSPPFSAYVVDSPATPTRVLGTVYRNTLNKPRFVVVSVSTPSSTTCFAYVDTNASPVQAVASAGEDTVGRVTISLFFIVLPGYYYKVLGGDILASWTEWT